MLTQNIEWSFLSKTQLSKYIWNTIYFQHIIQVIMTWQLVKLRNESIKTWKTDNGRIFKTLKKMANWSLFKKDHKTSLNCGINVFVVWNIKLKTAGRLLSAYLTPTANNITLSGINVKTFDFKQIQYNITWSRCKHNHFFKQTLEK